MTSVSFSYDYFQRFLAITLLILLSPLLIIIYAASLIVLGSPVVFKQTRVGLDCRPFVLYKFRSMSNLTDSSGALLPDSMRLNHFGSFLRSSSIDELPSLLNIALGHMAFVGPRPLPLHYLPLYSNTQLQRHSVLPGLTGWAQVHGRNTTDWSARFKLDLWYVANKSISLDIYILFLTIFVVLSRQGVNHSQNLTMPPFTGH